VRASPWACPGCQVCRTAAWSIHALRSTGASVMTMTTVGIDGGDRPDEAVLSVGQVQARSVGLFGLMVPDGDVGAGCQGRRRRDGRRAGTVPTLD